MQKKTLIEWNPSRDACIFVGRGRTLKNQQQQRIGDKEMFVTEHRMPQHAAAPTTAPTLIRPTHQQHSRPGVSTALRHISIAQARAIIENDHGQSWQQFAFVDSPQSLNWSHGSARVVTRDVFAWLGY